MPQPTLLLDADDTLWENNILFERAIAAFISFLDHREHSPAQVRAHLDRIERETVLHQGYGTGSFRRSLLRCFDELAGTPANAQQQAGITAFVDSIVHAEIELLPGVADALSTLASRFRLILVTKGDDLEQREKLRRSGLDPVFSAVEVLLEKTPEAYRTLLVRHGCDPLQTWMAGNSPRSDINPALQAGIHAILIPHAATWVLEHDDVLDPPPGQQLLHRISLAELAASPPAPPV